MLKSSSYVVALLGCAILVSGCQRKIEQNSIKMVIQAPQNKVGTFSTLPVGRKACFAVSITGNGINSIPASTCSPKSGIMAGYAESGQIIEAEVPSGLNRQIDLYLYLKESGDNSSCPSIGTKIASGQLKNTYFVGQAIGVATDKPVNDVTIQMNFPGESQNLAVQLSIPNSCLPNTASSPNFSIPTSAGVASGTGYQLKARIGRPVHADILVGSGYKLNVFSQ